MSTNIGGWVEEDAGMKAKQHSLKLKIKVPVIEMIHRIMDDDGGAFLDEHIWRCRCRQGGLRQRREKIR